MELTLSRFPASAPFPWKTLHPNTSLPIKLKPISTQSLKHPTLRKTRSLVVNAGQESRESQKPAPQISLTQQTPATDPPQGESDELSELGSEIKEAMKEREEKGGDFWSGVAEEIKEIEWPVFGKVVGTTGVVLGVIAGSSVVLLTVNAVLAELSDRVFAGRGVQDFFG
ncbi:hypothetical protein RJ639_001276 [Escallonia herrerae]|uniref:Preprotein translocase subunit SECE1 n=1 Tax=Escallonia herrerae TaxID=1293975 RepID=A0AA88X8T5_9ASTE|nr:hypothetical protein RJ639_001276 [Escallonia herrerae]